MAVGLKDVAARAGVSIKTVSNVVHGRSNVSPATRDRVAGAIRDLGYRPNLSARNLRRGRTGLIALGLPELQLPYFAELAQAVIAAAADLGWTVLIEQTDGVAEREQLALDGIRAHLLDGLILSPLSVGEEQIRRRRDTTPLVLLGERVFDGPADHVSIDNVAAAREATAHLVASGRRRIAAIGEQPGVRTHTPRLRRQGYEEALRAAGLPVDPGLVVEAPRYHRADGAAAMTALIRSAAPPDAVLCFNDLLAAGALRALHEHGLRVPADVAVVGWDDNDEGRFSVPTLTTVAPDKEAIARLAVDLLDQRVRSRTAAVPKELVAGHRLVVRESSATLDTG